jgi:creatinine amidohydrolase
LSRGESVVRTGKAAALRRSAPTSASEKEEAVSVKFQDMTSPQIAQSIKERATLLLPLGQTEQHGTHLQTGCDTVIAEHVATAVAERMRDEAPVLVLPPICYGYVPKSIQEWPGSFRVRWEVMVSYISDVLTSAAEMGFDKMIIISTHGPHGDVSRLAARDVFDRTGASVIVSIPHTMVAKEFARIRRSKVGGASHACEYETSLLMHFGYEVDLKGIDDRDSVKVCNEWVSGDMINGSGRVSWSTWALQLSETGVYGDASCSTPETGRQTFEAIIDHYVGLIRFVRRQEVPKQKFPTYPRSW